MGVPIPPPPPQHKSSINMRLFEPCYYFFVITTIRFIPLNYNRLEIMVGGYGLRVFLTVLAVVGAMTATIIKVEVWSWILLRGIFGVHAPSNSIGPAACTVRRRRRTPRLDSNNRIKKFKCFIWCRIEAREPLFLSLSCTEFVPNSQSIQCWAISHFLFSMSFAGNQNCWG